MYTCASIKNRQLVGVTACLERFLADADERGNTFFLQILDKQHLRLKGAFDRHIVSELANEIAMSAYHVPQNQQIKMVDETKLTSRKRKGVAHFVKYFPVYVSRVEQQLIGADGLEIRTHVDSAYEKIVHSMFECLKHMAKLDGEGEDKGQLNYHVLLVGECRAQEHGLDMIDLRREHALLCCRNLTAGHWFRQRVPEASRGYLQRKLGCIRQARTPETIRQIDRAYALLALCRAWANKGFTGIF